MLGGVCESEFLRQKLPEFGRQNNIEIYFSQPGLSSDNAVGVAKLCRLKYLGGK